VLIKKFILFIFLFSPLCWSDTFEDWKSDYAKRAQKRGLPKSFVLNQLKDLKLNEKVIDKDKNQITSSKTVDYNEFMGRWLRPENERINKAKFYLNKHRKLLEKIEKKYKVDKEVIIAIWGAETYYGEIMGSYNIVEAMASLAYDGRRRSFYETQLNAALRLIKAGHITQDQMFGSWAGATGQCQFMPSNIPAYGQDFDNDGKINIWSSIPDVFASIAMLLKKAGWKYGKSVGSLAIAPIDSDVNFDKYRTPAQYKKLGFKLDKVNPWIARRAATIPLQNSPIVLRGSNYRPILKWNNSSLFAAFNIIVMEELR
jgi:membrane-bound lytic murein transglycosylase B